MPQNHFLWFVHHASFQWWDCLQNPVCYKWCVCTSLLQYSVHLQCFDTTRDGKRSPVWHLSISQNKNPRGLLCLDHLVHPSLQQELQGSWAHPLSTCLLVTDVHLCSPLIFLNSEKHLQFKLGDLFTRTLQTAFFPVLQKHDGWKRK